jgi:RluA family pseudouridine synthase
LWDQIKIYLSDEDFLLLTKKTEVKHIFKNNVLDKKCIIYEDGDILIINKNPWINVHPWGHKTKESNIIFQVHDYLWENLNSLTFQPSLVHRIDRDTSGILLIAKKKDILTKLVKDFKEHTKIKKIYYALVLWKLSKKKWIIEKKLLRIPDAVNENKVQISEKWQEAITKYKVLNEIHFSTPQWPQIISEVEVEIITGRMHQIRVHFANEWTPIVWDNKYGNIQFNSYLNKNFWLFRQALHSWKIDFFHYGKNKTVSFEAKLKPDLISFVKNISKKK